MCAWHMSERMVLQSVGANSSGAQQSFGSVYVATYELKNNNGITVIKTVLSPYSIPRTVFSFIILIFHEAFYDLSMKQCEF